MKPPPNRKPTSTTPAANMLVISMGTARKLVFAALEPPPPLPPDDDPEVLVAVAGDKLKVALRLVPPPNSPVAVAVDWVIRGLPVKLCATLAADAVDTTSGIPLLTWNTCTLLLP